MRLLLASAGVTSPGIRDALVGMLGKPVEEADALCIPTAAYAMSGPQRAWDFVAGAEPRCPMTELGWRSVGLLELTALPSLGDDEWVSWVRAADVLLVGGGDALYLAHWMRESGMVELLPSLADTVWLGMSAGSMVLTPRIGSDFVASWRPPTGGDETLGLVDFAIFPHLDNPDLPENTTADAERWAAGIGGPAYAIDDRCAISVVDGAVEVVGDGAWRRFPG